ncbi:MAG: hypothetical protein Q8M02_11865 [Candidatus Didemnitutus sp.]|nr:hypothetical protein [Candidatus Didemnitutus sp.]
MPAAIALPLYPENMQAVRAAAAQVVAVDRVEVETLWGSIRPDMIAWRGNRPLAIEVEVTHPVSEQKSDTYRHERLSMLAINLRKIARSISFASLRDRLLSPSRWTRWVHNDFADSLTIKFRREAVTRSLTWRTSHKRAGKIPHVDSCPCPPRASKSHSSTFANAKLDCPSCPYYLPAANAKKIYAVRCAGHLAMRFPQATHEDWLCPEDAPHTALELENEACLSASAGKPGSTSIKSSSCRKSFHRVCGSLRNARGPGDP